MWHHVTPLCHRNSVSLKLCLWLLPQVLLSPGSVSNGTALNDTAATGSAANGNLGPGAILVNGTVNNGTGPSPNTSKLAGSASLPVMQVDSMTRSPAGVLLHHIWHLLQA